MKGFKLLTQITTLFIDFDYFDIREVGFVNNLTTLILGSCAKNS